MGWRPADVYACSVLEFAAAVDGWNSAHRGGSPEPMTLDDLAELKAYAAKVHDGTITR